MTLRPPKRFFSLDAVRGLAALSVVVWHWQHFFFQGDHPGEWHQKSQPFWTLISILYLRGYLAVDLFFSLSGFVFFWLYSNKVASGSISVWRFAVLRFSRLYPLHIATLLFVAAGQYLFRNLTGGYFVYPFNDTWHFALNAFFISAWGLQSGNSFNAPIWSVSVEVFLYGLFFVVCRLLPVRIWLTIIFAALGIALPEGPISVIGRGIASFFLGGSVYLMYQRILASRAVSSQMLVWPLITSAIWAASLYVFARDWRFSEADISMFGHSNVASSLKSTFDFVTSIWAQLVLFPLTILSLALVETRRGSLGRRLAWLGDISYSSYLLHFPLQLSFMLVWTACSFDRNLFYEPAIMVTFFLLLIAISFASHRYFEMPVQIVLRRTQQPVRGTGKIAE